MDHHHAGRARPRLRDLPRLSQRAPESGVDGASLIGPITGTFGLDPDRGHLELASHKPHRDPTCPPSALFVSGVCLRVGGGTSRELDVNRRFRDGSGDAVSQAPDVVHGLRRGSCLRSRCGRARGRKRVVHSPDMPTLNPRDIDWAEVAAKARADLGDEQIARFSDRLRKAMNVTADTVRPGAFRPDDTEDLRFGEAPAGA